MRHFNYIKAVYAIFNVNVNEDNLLAVYNLAKRVAMSSSLAQFSYANVDWSVRYGGNYMRVSLSCNGTSYSIYDGKQYKEPSIEVIIK